MILVRMTFRAKYGKAGEMVQHFRENQQEFERLINVPTRVLTDLSGPFDTVVLEQTVESLDGYEKMLQQAFSDPDTAQLFAMLQPLIESGSREFYRIEVESGR